MSKRWRTSQVTITLVNPSTLSSLHHPSFINRTLWIPQWSQMWVWSAAQLATLPCNHQSNLPQIPSCTTATRTEAIIIHLTNHHLNSQISITFQQPCSHPRDTTLWSIAACTMLPTPAQTVFPKGIPQIHQQPPRSCSQMNRKADLKPNFQNFNLKKQA